MGHERGFVSSDVLRGRFAHEMSQMYRVEVPAYGTLVDLVADVNRDFLQANETIRASLDATEGLERITLERHGAIRLGTAEELFTMRRVFAVMGMHPVGYYDLSVAGIPVHSTCFRPTDERSLKRNPFRVFTSLLRLDLIHDEKLREDASQALTKRRIFSPEALRLVEVAESDGGLFEPDASAFIREILETFRWHDQATVNRELYDRLHNAHRLVADIVSFKGPHINHLTPRTLDIDRVQVEMPLRGISPKEKIEGPPSRHCPILLRQTSFKALDEPISFQGADGSWVSGTHSARFGEIEQRGQALTPKGRALYDRLLVQSLQFAGVTQYSAEDYAVHVFSEFPDDYAKIRQQKLGYFEYRLTSTGKHATWRWSSSPDIEELIEHGFVDVHPIVYEDFLPVSAAGIFRSNLGDQRTQSFAESPNKPAFEAALGAEVIDEFGLYEQMQQSSINRCLAAFAMTEAVSSQ